MRQVKNIDFPYPFLMDGNDNFKDSKFNIDCNLKKDKNIELDIDVKITCPFVENLLLNNLAKIALNIEQRTYRSTVILDNFLNTNGTFNHNFHRKLTLRNAIDDLSPNYNIEIVAMIIATKDIEFKYDECMAPIFSYFDNNFKYNLGSIIGYSNFEEYEYPTDKKVSSIFTISKFTDPSIKDPFKITLTGDVIEIQVQESTLIGFETLRKLHQTHNKIYNSVFVYPAIQLAIYSMLTNFSSYKELKWCRAIGNKISAYEGLPIESVVEDYENKIIDIDDILKYTNLILDDLLVDSFNEAIGDEN